MAKFWELFEEKLVKTWDAVMMGLIVGFTLFILSMNLPLPTKIFAIFDMALSLSIVFSFFQTLDDYKKKV